ncbi:hypothetical protein PP939_gp238 [Rhizobium phage RL38J1]|uniref:Uncharacterized protein n=1 Tax=Rhizobium phage RL38J1 TaxID=2663232 RepID=A0A6B9J2Y4_9CAUD|nr:hypothetical protein PP939_gp238 [Rhizobium phage RL38J1]QGZ13983.1 hypothetical protein RL38J1_238 [Rhizobium phage RL38J1]
MLTDNFEDFIRPEFEYFIYVQMKLRHEGGKIYSSRLVTKPIYDESEIQQAIEKDRESCINQLSSSRTSDPEWDQRNLAWVLENRKYQVFKVEFERIEFPLA